MTVFDESAGHCGGLLAIGSKVVGGIDGVVSVVTAEESGGAFIRVRVEQAGGALASDVTDSQPALPFALHFALPRHNHNGLHNRAGMSSICKPRAIQQLIEPSSAASHSQPQSCTSPPNFTPAIELTNPLSCDNKPTSSPTYTHPNPLSHPKQIGEYKQGFGKLRKTNGMLRLSAKYEQFRMLIGKA